MHLLRNVLKNSFGSSQIIRLAIVRFYKELPFEDIPEVSPTFIKRIFKRYNITFEEGYTNFTIKCPICCKDAKASSRTYINKTTGMYMCSSCKHTGQWSDLENYLDPKKKGKTSSKLQNGTPSEMSKMIMNSLGLVAVETVSLKDFSQEKSQTILGTFKLPNVSRTVFSSVDVRIDHKEENLYFPLENVESEIVGYKKLDSTKGDVMIIPSIMCGGLLTGKVQKSKDTAVIVPTISDFLVLMDSKISSNVVCLPNGVNNLSQYVLPSLERFKKLVLWFGNDIKSWDSAKQFAQKLGEKRCHFIRYVFMRPLAFSYCYTNDVFYLKSPRLWNIWNTTNVFDFVKMPKYEVSS